MKDLIKQSVIVLFNSVYQLSYKRFLWRKVMLNKFSDICNTAQPVNKIFVWIRHTEEN